MVNGTVQRQTMGRAAAVLAVSAVCTGALVVALLRARGLLVDFAGLLAAAIVVAAAIRYRRELAQLQVGDIIGWLALLTPLAAIAGPAAALPGLPQAFAFRVLLGLIAVLGLLHLASAGLTRDWKPELPAILIVLWFAWLVLALAWAPDKAAGLRYLLVLLSMLALVATTAYAGSSARRLKVLAAMLAAGYGLAILVALFETFTGSHLSTSALASAGSQSTVSVTSFFYNQNNFATYLAMAWPFLLGMVVITRRPSWIALSLAGMGTGVFALVHTGSRSSIIAFAVETLALCVFLWGAGSRSARRLLVTFAIVLVAGSGWLAFNNSDNALLRQFRLADLVSSAQQGYGSGDTRLSLQVRGLSVVPRFLLAGAGPGNAESQVATPDAPPDVNNLHDWWLELLVDGGLPGLVIFVAAYVILMRGTLRGSRSAEDRLLRYLSTCTFVALLGYLVGALGPSTAVSFAPMWILLGLALALVTRHRTQLRAAAAQ